VAKGVVWEKGVPFQGALASVLDEERTVPIGRAPIWDQDPSGKAKLGSHKDFKLVNGGRAQKLAMFPELVREYGNWQE